MKAWISINNELQVEKNLVHDYLSAHIPEVFANDQLFKCQTCSYNSNNNG